MTKEDSKKVWCCKRVMTGLLILVIAGWVLAFWKGLPREVAPGGGRTMVELQLAPDVATARGIVGSWKKDGRLEDARKNLQEDNRFVAIYLLAGIVSLAATGAICVCHPRSGAAALALVGVASLTAAALVDWRLENPLLKEILELGAGPATSAESTRLVVCVQQMRAAAIAKFSFLIVTFGLLASLFLASLRLLAASGKRDQQAECKKQPSFKNAMTEEVSSFDGAAADRVKTREEQREPQAIEGSPDFVGLALSGGGIRSATFALGVVSRLARLGVLQHVDYLSTVSGGGYLGGWLSAWRSRGTAAEPSATEFLKGRAERGREPVQVRHLREFSNFLMPRRGFFDVDTWNGILALVCGLAPALIIALALIAATQFVWLLLVFFTAGPAVPTNCFGWAAAVLTAVLMAVGKSGPFWRTLPSDDRKKTDDRKKSGDRKKTDTDGTPAVSAGVAFVYCLLAASAIGLSGGAAHCMSGCVRTDSGVEDAEHVGQQLLGAAWIPPLFFMACIWLAVGAALTVVRLLLVCGPGPRVRLPILTLDRVLRKLMIAGVLGAAMGGLWVAAVALRRYSEWGAVAPLTGAVGSATLFAWLRNSFVSLFKSERPTGLVRLLKPLLPMVLAYAAVLLLYVGTAVLLLQELENNPARWLMAGATTSVVLVLSLFLSPELFGLHEFYRARIARAFLGASNPSVGQNNRRSDEHILDDLRIERMPVGKPYHLVCCAANDVGADSVETLDRGARSATVSRHGVMLGGHKAMASDLTLGAALTASAAAFNSQMGGISVGLGPAAAFLMCALNLRLGLWAPNPLRDAATTPLFPGWRRYLEMFGRTRADESVDQVHLSDGGHFENLALYELVRRRCRFIIVSDAGADPNVKFEDFGNAVRRVREDFNVDIEIDLSPLAPDACGFSRQHVAVGTIRYDATGVDLDVGVLVYFKPTLTGDEAVDLLNYRALNPEFPHESTGDQFYDEAQWESYRSLGSHAAFVAFDFLDGNKLPEGPDGARRIPGVFGTIRNRWYPTPPDFGETFVALNQRFLGLEKRLAHEAAPELVAAIYPELKKIESNPVPTPQPGSAPPVRNVHLAIEIMQLIEDVWVSADFDRNYNHPQMIGWINAFHRWMRIESVRRWWPFLIPLFSPGMRRFAEERFDAPRPVAPTKSGNKPKSPQSSEFALHVRRAVAGDGDLAALGLKPSPRGGKEFVLEIELPASVGPACRVAVGAMRATFSPDHGDEAQCAEWTDDGFQIRPGMWNTGLGSAFLRKIIDERALDGRKLKRLRVLLDLDKNDSHAGRGTGHRRERNDLMMFYKSQGFQNTTSTPTAVVLERDV